MYGITLENHNSPILAGVEFTLLNLAQISAVYGENDAFAVIIPSIATAIQLFRRFQNIFAGGKTVPFNYFGSKQSKKNEESFRLHSFVLIIQSIRTECILHYITQLIGYLAGLNSYLRTQKLNPYLWKCFIKQMTKLFNYFVPATKLGLLKAEMDFSK